MLQLLADALQQSLVFLPLTLGIYLTYRIINITDLTVGSSFVIGAAVFAKLLTNGATQIEATLAALVGGLLAGLGVYALQRYAKINSLIASILAVFMLFSVSFAIMNQPNISLLNNQTTLNTLQNMGPRDFNFALMALGLVIFGLVYLLLKSKIGLRFRAYGNNANLLNRLGHNAYFYLAASLMISNMLAALCGVMTAQINGYADIHMDDGVALTAIGAVVIGCQLMKALFIKNKNYYPALELIGCVFGAFIYFFVLHVFLEFNINPIYLKLCLGLLLAVFLSTAHYSRERGLQYETAIAN